MKYRSDIDGLRTIAVLPVLLYHAGNSFLSGGYAGVDIFFVISGFLITSILLAELDDGTFLLRRFYERRVRRIFPLLFLVVSVSLIACAALFNPAQLLPYARSALWALFSASNIFFWQEDSYFAESSDLKPLLHTWSLAVEEQYYIVFPLILMGLWRLRRQGSVLFMLIGIFAASLLLAQWGGILNADTRHALTGIPAILSPDFGYFLLPTRAWELMCGSIAAYIIRHHSSSLRSIPPALSHLLGFIGLGMIAAAYVTFDKHTPFPSAYTALPVLGAAFIILFHREDRPGLISQILSARVMVFTGLISYSLYLWHQPVYALLRISFPDITPTALYMTIPAIYGLSVLSWAYVEQPFRSKPLMPAPRLFRVMAIWFGVLVALLGLVVASNGFINRYPPSEQQFYISKDDRGAYVRTRFNSLAERDFPTNDKPNLLVIGDSHAQDMVNILSESGAASDWNLSTLRISTRCQLYIGPEETSQFIAPDDTALCAKERAKFNERSAVLIPRANRIVIDFSWKLWAAERMATTLQSLRETYPQAKFTVIGLKYFGTVSFDDVRAKSPDSYHLITQPIDPERRKINDTLRHNVRGVPFIDLLDLLCAKSTECPIFTPDGRLISYDGGHLTQDGATYLGSELNKLGVFSKLAQTSQ